MAGSLLFSATGAGAARPIRASQLENEINSPEVYNDPQLLREKSDELSDLRFHQDELFAAWEAAVEEQEQYEQSAGEE